MIPLKGAFVVYQGGFLCSQECSVEVEADILKDLTGVSSSVKRMRILTLKKTFNHGIKPFERQPVTVIKKLITGNVFKQDGYVRLFKVGGDSVIVLTGNESLENVQEFIDQIKEL